MLKKFTFSFMLILFSSLLILTSVSAAPYINATAKSKEDVIKNEELVELDERLIQEEIGIQAIVVDLPGPLKYSGTIPNHLLPQLIDSRKKKADILNWMAWGMAIFSVPGAPQAGIPAGWAGVADSAAGMLAGNPMARYQTAYDRGENVYYGAYYSTPQPGLTTVPFIYYSKTPLIYQYN